MPPSSLKVWLLAIRPKTLPAAMAPVFIGSALAYGDGVEHAFTAGVCLFGALMIQIGTNFVNDYCDHKTGADNENRIGPVRVTQAGLIQPSTMKVAIAVVFFLAWMACLWLFKRGGWPIIAIGVFSILSGIFYTAGKRPLGYRGLGELFVFIFFGPVAVAGTYYVQSLEINAAIILAGVAPGLLSSAILVVNNLRDIEGDRASGKNTLAVRFGPTFAKNEYLFAILTASLFPVLIYFYTEDHIFILASSMTCLLAIPTINTVFTRTDGPSLNHALAETGKLLLLFSILFSVGWVL